MNRSPRLNGAGATRAASYIEPVFGANNKSPLQSSNSKWCQHIGCAAVYHLGPGCHHRPRQSTIVCRSCTRTVIDCRYLVDTCPWVSRHLDDNLDLAGDGRSKGPRANALA